MINNFLEKLNKSKILCMLTGGYAYKKHFDETEDTSDYDIHIYLSHEQLNDKNTFEYIYEEIKSLYEEFKKKYIHLMPITKFDYAKYSKKYINNNLLNNQIEYFTSNILCDIQFETFDDTLADIVIYYSPDIYRINDIIGEDYYINKQGLIKEINNYYDALINENKNTEKINKIKRRINFIENNIR